MLLGIQNMDTMPHPRIMALTHGKGLSAGASSGSSSDIGGMGLSVGASSSGMGLYATQSHGGKLSKIGQAFNKAFNPQKNGVAHAVEHAVAPVVKVGDQIKTGVVKTYNQAKTGINNTFNSQLGKNIDYDLKTTARYAIPAITGWAGGTAGALLGGLSTFGAAAPVGAIAGSAAGAYAGYKADQALGLGGHNDFNPVGKGLKKHKKVKGGNIKKELEKVWDKVPEGFHQPLEDLGRAGVEYAGYHIPPKKGRGVKGSMSKTHKGDMDYTTKKGDMYYHRGGHDETDTSSETSFDGGSVKKRKPRMVKGSAEAKAYMAKIRTLKGKGIAGKGQVDNNSPHSGAVRMSPYQNF
jgi:hypothetical protein